MRFALALSLMLVTIQPSGAQIALPTQTGLLRDACELDCTCKPVPGTPDRCAGYWTIARDLHGGLKLVPNLDLKACDRAIASNLQTLNIYYGKSPEISVPDSLMEARLVALPLPSNKPIFVATGEAESKADDSNLRLIDLIATSRSRVALLKSQAYEFGTVSSITVGWKKAVNAATVLVEKSDAIMAALTHNRPWPSLAVFAPKVWALWACGGQHADAVTELAQRFDKNQADSVWMFTFYGDFSRLLSLFGANPAGNSGADWNSDRYRAIAVPFFVQSSETVDERKKKTLFTAADVRKFRAAAAELEAALEPYVSDRIVQQNAQRDRLRATFETERDRVGDLGKAVQTQLAALGELTTEIKQLEQQKSSAEGEVDRLRSGASVARQTLDLAIRNRDEARRDNKIASDNVTTELAAVAAARQALEAIVLNCGGENYKDCTDANAKLEYDRKVYEANNALFAARSSYLQAVDRSVSTMESFLIREEAVLGARRAVADFIEQLDAKIDLVDKLAAELQEATETVIQAQSAASAVSSSFDDLAKAMDELDKALPR